MSVHIAMAGKGGTGKTTVAALLVRYLVEREKGTVVAVDADPNSTLGDALGIRVERTISDIIEAAKEIETTDNAVRGNYIKEQLPDNALTHAGKYDLLVLGRPPGAGCYCIPMSILKNSMTALGNRYDYMVIDNEAGMEYLSRQVIEHVHIMLIISDATQKGIRTAKRIYNLARSLNIEIEQPYLVVTKAAKASDTADLEEEIAGSGLKLLGVVPYDPQLAEYDLQDRPLVQLPPENPAVQASMAMFEKIIK